MARSDLTAERLHELFNYYKYSGLFTFRGTRKRGRALKETSDNYRIIRVDGVSHSAHRLAWLYVFGNWPANLIDHKDGNKFNNRIDNLRDANKSINSQNIKTAKINNAASGLLGVFKNGRKWVARIGINGKRHHLGNFNTAQDAHIAYIEAKRRLHPGCTI